MRALEDDTDYKHKTLTKVDLDLVEMDEAGLRQSLKDRQHGSGNILEASLAGVKNCLSTKIYFAVYFWQIDLIFVFKAGAPKYTAGIGIMDIWTMETPE